MKKALLPILLLANSTAAVHGQAPEPAFTTAGAFIAMSVQDLEASKRWYEEKLGLRLIFQPPPQEGTRVVVLAGGGLMIELQQNPAAVPLRTAAPQVTHTALVHGIFKAGITVNDLDCTLAILRERGVPLARGPFPARENVPANFMIRDNDGNYLQFFAPMSAPPGTAARERSQVHASPPCR